MSRDVTTDNKIYILQKDLPNVRAGARYEHYDRARSGSYYTLVQADIKHIYNCPEQEANYYGAAGYAWDCYTVENSPEWFKLYEPTKIEKFKKDIIQLRNFLNEFIEANNGK